MSIAGTLALGSGAAGAQTSPLQPPQRIDELAPGAARAQTSPSEPTPSVDERGRGVTTTQTRPFQPTLRIEETLTNNVDLTSNDVRRGDLVSEITPGFRVLHRGARTSFAGTVEVPVLLYVHTGSDNNQVYPQVALTGNAELIERFLFIDGDVNVSQQFLTPFGARPQDLATTTDNRYTSQLYRVSPYIKGETADKISYELRNDNIWSNLNDTPSTLDGVPISTSNSYTNQTIGRIGRDPLPFGWEIDYNRNDVQFRDQEDSQLMELVRLLVRYRTDQTLELVAGGGYERNDFPFTDYDGAIYGAGYRWRPNPVLSSEGFWEHRFFGSSYRFTFDYRTPRSVLSVNASRQITTYPQQLAALPAGGNVPLLLDRLFSSRIVDPTERLRLVDQVIRDRGLPETLAGSVTLYTQQVTLQNSAIVTMGLLGARNSVFLNGTYLRQEPITGSGNPLPPELAGFNDNTQYGANLVWTHQLTPLVTVGGDIAWSRTIPNEAIVLPGAADTLGTTNLTQLRARVSRPLSARTTVYAGLRYQRQTSNLPGNEYSEAAAFAGLSYQFR